MSLTITISKPHNQPDINLEQNKQTFLHFFLDITRRRSVSKPSIIVGKRGMAPLSGVHRFVSGKLGRSEKTMQIVVEATAKNCFGDPLAVSARFFTVM